MVDKSARRNDCRRHEKVRGAGSFITEAKSYLVGKEYEKCARIAKIALQFARGELHFAAGDQK